MSDSRKPVFVSYASQDADAANRVGAALRAAGVEVWLDTSELRGGDAWDASIRRQIRDCSLFLPIVSTNTQSRSEGYFRLEWRLAADRSRLMADDEPFILPVVIDAIAEGDARVPDAFRERQWIRMPRDGSTDELVRRVAELAAGARLAPARGERASPAKPRALRKSSVAIVVVGVLVALAGVALLATREGKRAPEPQAVADRPAQAAAGSNSVAVLPFRNLSDAKDNEYFSDGISEELLTTLQKVPGLQVAARSSSFALKGANASAQQIGERLGVAHLVEGSVRRAGNTVRITARLSRTSTGQQVWSDAYTREMGDVFALQSELAQAIAENLLGILAAAPDAAERAMLRLQLQDAARGGTRNSQAHEAYLQGLFHLNQEAIPEAMRSLEKAVALDASFVNAWADLSRAGWLRGAYAPTAKEYEDGFRTARRAAERATALNPQLASGWLAKSNVQMAADFDWSGAAESLQRAQALAPNDAEVLHRAARLAYAVGERQKAVHLVQRSLALDPLDPRKRILFALALDSLGRFEEAQAQFERVTAISPRSPWAHAGVALMLLRRQRLREAEGEIAKAPVEWERLTVHSQIMWALDRKAEADASLTRLRDTLSETAAYQLAQVYAHRGDRDRAFEWLRRAARQRDPGLALCKSDRTFVPLHADPRWQAFLKELGVGEPSPERRQ